MAQKKYMAKKRSYDWLNKEFLYDDRMPMSDRESFELFQDECCTSSNDYYMSGISSAYSDYVDSYNY